MKYFSYQYKTIIRFDSHISHHSFKLRSIPCDNDFQQVAVHRLFLEPHDNINNSADSFGNNIQYGYKADVHDLFVFISCGRVSQTCYRIKDVKPSALYCMPTSLTRSSELMLSFLDNIKLIEKKDIDKALTLCHAVYQWMAYTPGSTAVSTTASEAFAKQKGVCQDYAHIFIALCRKCGIAVRYVYGFIIGCGETHAWAEIYYDGFWYGIDPTHDRLIEYGYIKVAHGRDADDCPANRGVFSGCATQQIEIEVKVNEIEKI